MLFHTLDFSDFFFVDKGLCNFRGTQHAEWPKQEAKNMLVYAGVCLCLCMCMCMHLLAENDHHGDLYNLLTDWSGQ